MSVASAAVIAVEIMQQEGLLGGTVLETVGIRDGVVAQPIKISQSVL